ncbi:MAG TPA: hypothetical protein VER17_11900 [Tepidisphaeraceae bacterium]|nr:hypothetical protein [Tepidisphaeraceae bacterium]
MPALIPRGELHDHRFDSGETVTLTLSNLPQHGAVILTGGFGFGWDPATPVPAGAQMTVKIGDRDITVGPDGKMLDNFTQHTGSSLTLEFKVSGISSDATWLPYLGLSLETPKLTLGSATLTVGEEVEVPVAATTHIDVGIGNPGYKTPWPFDLTVEPKVIRGSSVSASGSVSIAAGVGAGVMTLWEVEAGVTLLAAAVPATGATSQPVSAQALHPQVRAEPHPPEPGSVARAIEQCSSPEGLVRAQAVEKLKQWLLDNPSLEKTLERAVEQQPPEAQIHLRRVLTPIKLTLDGSKIHVTIREMGLLGGANTRLVFHGPDNYDAVCKYTMAGAQDLMEPASPLILANLVRFLTSNSTRG